MKMRTMLILSSFVTSVAWTVPVVAYGATYYVAKTGSNNYTCSQAQSASTPKLTINAGLSCMQGGDTLIIKAGTYAESIEPKAIPSGTASDQTVIKAAPGEVVVIKPNNTGNSIGDAVSIYDRSYITLDGLTIDGRRLRIGGGGSGSYSHYITFQNGIIRNTDMSCTGTQGPAGSNSHINYINNEIYNCGTSPSETWNGEIVGHGLYIHARDSIIERNRIHHVRNLGIQLYHQSDPKAANNNIIRYNELYSNGTYGMLISSGSGNVVHDNIVRGNAAGGIMIAYGTSNNQINNNRIYDNNGDCIWIRTTANNTTVTNNACWQNTRNRIFDEGTNTTLSNNLFSTPPSGSAAAIPSAPVSLKVAP